MSEWGKHNIYRDGHVYVRAELCSTCIFRPGNLMGLKAGRVRQMVDDAKAHDSTIVCHQTLDTDERAACRGFFDRYPTPPLQIAQALGLIVWVKLRGQSGRGGPC